MPRHRRPALALLVVALCLTLSAGCDTGVTGNHPPAFETIYHQVFEVGKAGNRLLIVATDPDGDPLRYSLQGTLWPGEVQEEGFRWAASGDRLPAGMSFASDPDKAVFSWDPISSQVGLHEVTFEVDDGKDQDRERITVEVRLSDEVGGAPHFVSPASFVLQLARSSSIGGVIAVRDDDSSRIELELRGAPEGLEFKARDDGKRGEFSWTPSEEQVRAQSIYSFEAHARDEEGNQASQELRVVIRSKDGGSSQQGCPGEPPDIEHEPLRDQSGRQDFPIQAWVFDDGEVARVFALYTVGDPNDSDSYQIAELEPEGEGSFSGALPNLLEEDSGPLAYYYSVCAVDDDDSSGEDCDHFRCAPDESLFRFLARVEAGGCADDANEPNGSLEEAVELSAGSYPGLWLCPDDEDWFRLNVREGDELDASILFASADGDLAMDLYGPDGGLLQSAETESDLERIAWAVSQQGAHHLRVRGRFEAGSEGNGYHLELQVSRECLADEAEPNDSLEQAGTLPPGRWGPFTLCPEDQDHFLLDTQGQLVRVQVRFDHEQGDLELTLLGPSGEALRNVSSETDDEIVTYQQDFSGPLGVRVFGYRGASNSYELQWSRLGDDCSDGGREPNDTLADASDLPERVDAAICVANDQDIYGVALPAFTGLEVFMDFEHSAGDLDLYLWDEGGELLSRAISSSDDELLRFPGLSEDALVYLQVRGWEGARNFYSLVSAERDFRELCLPDYLEPSDGAAAAAALPLDEGSLLLRGLSFCGDEDWYALELEAPAESILASVTASEGGAPLQLELYREGNLLDATEPDPRELLLLQDGLAPGRYLLRVFGTGPGAGRLYSLEVVTE